MTGFHRHRRSKLVFATFSVFEADLLRALAAQLVELLHNERAMTTTSDDPLEALLDFSGPTTAPEDPVLQRLFPTAYHHDEEAAGEFRRFTEGGLRDSKAKAAEAIIDALEEAGLPTDPTDEEHGDLVIDVELDEPSALVWMRAFTDLRLALGTRLEVEEGDQDYWDSLPDEDPRAQAHHLYEWLGYLQETLVDAVG
ncbi:MAG TPA: DUF2017 domain-containing protein [Nocardioides sp.]|nr:DUF2017 domain-containing protein [Nocardioides sp.]